MVGLVILSHSKKLAEGVKELALEMAPDIPIAISGGTEDGSLGSSYENIYDAILSVDSKEGTIVLFDLGSSFMNGEMAKESLESELKGRVEIVDAALVEGAITAAVEISLEKNIDEILETLKALKLGKIS